MVRGGLRSVLRACKLYGLHSGGACGVEFERDVGKEDDALGGNADLARNAFVGLCLAFPADRRVVEAVEERKEIAADAVAEEQFLRRYGTRRIDVQAHAAAVEAAQSVDGVVVQMPADAAARKAFEPDVALQRLEGC